MTYLKKKKNWTKFFFTKMKYFYIFVIYEVCVRNTDQKNWTFL